VAEPTYEELKERLAELERKKERAGNLEFRVSEKGGGSVYGLGRFPVTLYYEQCTTCGHSLKRTRTSSS
jgi:hypothetical protein